jgi:AmiR/NasT family two-component response regulator
MDRRMTMREVADRILEATGERPDRPARDDS